MSMEVIRKEHSTSRKLLKQQLVTFIRQQGLDSEFMWDNFAFAGSVRGTKIQGEILPDIIHVEVSGWFEKMVARKFREEWQGGGKSSEQYTLLEDSERQIEFIVSESQPQMREHGHKNIVVILERLAEFKERGIITDQDFQTQKQHILEQL